jgi:hypothetical protein
MNTTPPNDFALIESIVNSLPTSSQADARNLFESWSKQIATVSAATGTTQGANQQNAAPPPQPSLSVAGANGAFALTITPPSLPQPATLWYRISYSTVKGFTSGVTTLEPTTSTSMVLNLPGASLFFEVEASFNKQVWSQAVLASQSATSAGLVSSAATAAAASFNQTNLGVVTSRAVGSTVVAEISGADSPLSSLTALKGAAQTVLPGASIVGVTPATTQYVGWTGDDYELRPTLAGVLRDGITPIGKFSAVGTGVPVLPTITPIVSGGQIIGYNVTAGGSGAGADYTLTLATTGGGTGATFGPQTITGGVLISVAPGNPGTGYSGGTTVVVSGGIFPGVEGGGTALATTNGRLTT